MRPLGAQSDLLNFQGLHGDDLGIIRTIVDGSELTRNHSPDAISKNLAWVAVDGISEFDGGEKPGVLAAAAPIDAWSNTTKWCIVEQPTGPHSDEHAPDRAPSGALITIEGSWSSDYHSPRQNRQSLSQIIPSVMGALLIIAGLLVMTVPVWYTAHLAFLNHSGALGLVFLVVGVALAVLSWRARSSAHRAQSPH
jgi:uncharacterized membrane protein SirB2